MSKEEQRPPAYVLAFPHEEVLREQKQVDLLKLSLGRRTGSIHLEIEALTPLFTGNGSYEPDASAAALIKAPLRRGKVPCVAGSSIKGACRQVVELLSQSDEPPTESDKSHVLISLARHLFGTLGRRGRFTFDDAVPVGPCQPKSVLVRVPHEPKYEAGRRFYLPHASLPPLARPTDPQTLPLNALPAGTRLRTTLRFTEASDKEIGWVLLGLGIGHFDPRLGGAKYDDLGRVRWSVVEIRLRKGFGKENRMEGSVVDSFAGNWIGMAKDALPPAGRSALERLVAAFGAGAGDPK